MLIDLGKLTNCALLLLARWVCEKPKLARKNFNPYYEMKAVKRSSARFHSSLANDWE